MSKKFKRLNITATSLFWWHSWVEPLLWASDQEQRPKVEALHSQSAYACVLCSLETHSCPETPATIFYNTTNQFHYLDFRNKSKASVLTRNIISIYLWPGAFTDSDNPVLVRMEAHPNLTHRLRISDWCWKVAFPI